MSRCTRCIVVEVGREMKERIEMAKGLDGNEEGRVESEDREGE